MAEAVREVTMREIATAIGVDRTATCRRAAREGWPYREIPAPGCPRRLYKISVLPADICERLDTPTHANGASSRKEGEAGAVPASPQRSLNTPSTTVEAPAASDKMSQSVPPDALIERYEALPGSRRAAARAKLSAVESALEISARERIPMRAACERAASASASPWSASTLLAAWRIVRALPAHLKAPALADRRRGRPAAWAACDPAAWEAFKSDYLRAEQPAASSCHRRLARLAAANGWTIPGSPAALVRRLNAEVPPGAIALARQGPEAAAARMPALIRDREGLAVMQILCCDGHTWDTRVEWPDGQIGRPVMTSWQDVRSGPILGWRIDRSESADAYRLSLADVLWQYGAPEHVIADNGRGICAQALTGQAAHKFRGKADPDCEVTGLLTELVGPSNIHFTIPYSGRSKAIERAFLDLSRDIAKDPRLAGFYAGPGPERKPHDYDSSKGIPLERFRQVVADGIAQHNSRSGRRGQGMHGKSFDEVFEAGLAAGPARKLTPEALSRWLLAPAIVTPRASDGSVEVHKTRYWAPALADRFAGKPASERKAVVRYDPERLERPARVELPGGQLVGLAEPQGRTPYLDRAAAEEAAKARARQRRADREALAAHRAVGTAELAAMLDKASGEEQVQDLPVLPDSDPAAPELLPVAPAAMLDETDRESDELIRSEQDLILEMRQALGGGSP